MGISIKIDRSRWWLQKQEPFYSMLASSLPDSWAPDNSGITTAATNGVNIFWFEPFLDSLTKPQTNWVLLHEVLHNALLHLFRFRIDETVNIALDMVIWRILNKIPNCEAPPAAYECPPEWMEWVEEEIIRELRKKEKKQGKSARQIFGSGLGQDMMAPPTKAPGQPAPGQPAPGQPAPGQAPGQPSLKDEWLIKINEAEIASKFAKRGDVPADISRMLGKSRQHKIRWRDETSEFTRDCSATRVDWNRAPRRHAWQSVIYPRRKRNEFSSVVLVCDSSGSMGADWLAEIIDVFADCCAEIGCRALRMDIDADIKHEEWIEPGETWDRTVKGGGGTDFRPAFDRVKELIEQGETIAGLIYATDLEGKFPSYVPEYPVLWLSWGSASKVPFGRLLKLE